MKVALLLCGFRKWIDSVIPTLLGLLLGLLVCTEVLQVLGRYFFGFGFIWIQDILSLTLLFIGWVGAGYLWVKKSHLSVEIFRFKRSFVIDWINPVSDILALLLVICLLPAIVQAMVGYSGLKMDGLDVPASIKLLPCLVGLVLLGVGAVLNLLEFRFGANDQFSQDHD